MRMIRIRFIYPDSLTEDQKNILKVNFEAIRDSAVKSLRTHLFAKANKQMKAQLEIMGNIAEGQIAFCFPSPHVASFAFPTLDLIGKSITIGGKQYHLGNVMPKKKIISFIKNVVSKDMGIDGSLVLYEVEEYEIT